MPKSEAPDAPTGLPARIWRSMIRAPLVARTETERKRIVLNHLVLHFRPVRVPERTLRYTLTFGLGGMSLVLVSLLMATGILLMFAYEPVPGNAYDSIVRLQDEVRFGGLVRNIHHWSANFLIVVAFLHLLRVFFTGGVHQGRQFNWVIGLCLFTCIIGSNFTGYLMPWDQLSYWAITISTGMIGYIPLVGDALQNTVRGGPEIGSRTLTLFYTLHTTVMPVCLILLMAFHFWRVRKAGGVVSPPAPDDRPESRPPTVLFVPNLLLREFTVGLILVAVVVVCAAAFDAGLGAAANPGMSPNPAKAPWYFLGLQELLLHFDPVVAVVVIPTLVVLFLVAIPYLKLGPEQSGIWFLSPRGRRLCLSAAALALIITPAWIVLDEVVLHSAASSSGLPGIIVGGLLPLAILIAGLAAAHAFMGKTAATGNEKLQALFAFLVTALIVLTATGIWFRGAGMALTLPWWG